MSGYWIHLEWQGGADGERLTQPLTADVFEEAKIEAALLFALTDFEAGTPSSYVILENGQTAVYRYPETWRAGDAERRA